jgi:DNA-binding NtrC family response regulator
VKREHIIHVLKDAGGLVSGPTGAAARLGVPRTTLQSKLKKLRISRSRKTFARVLAETCILNLAPKLRASRF